MYSLPGPGSPCTQTHHGAQTCTVYSVKQSVFFSIFKNIISKQIRQIDARKRGVGLSREGGNICYPYLVPKFKPERKYMQNNSEKRTNGKHITKQKSVQIYDFRPFVVQILVHQVLGNGDLVMQVIFAL